MGVCGSTTKNNTNKKQQDKNQAYHDNNSDCIKVI